MTPLLVGLLFGLLLERAGLTRYDKIVGVYRLTDLTVLKFLGSGLAVGAVAVQAAHALGLAPVVPVVPTHAAGALIGGGLFGVGMALAGFCPGTVVAGAATGQIDYLVPGLGGMFAGAIGFALAQPWIERVLARFGAATVTTLPRQLGLSGGLLALLLLELAAIGFYALERAVRPR